MINQRTELWAIDETKAQVILAALRRWDGTIPGRPERSEKYRPQHEAHRRLAITELSDFLARLADEDEGQGGPSEGNGP